MHLTVATFTTQKRVICAVAYHTRTTKRRKFNELKQNTGYNHRKFEIEHNFENTITWF